MHTGQSTLMTSDMCKLALERAPAPPPSFTMPLPLQSFRSLLHCCAHTNLFLSHKHIMCHHSSTLATQFEQAAAQITPYVYVLCVLCVMCPQAGARAAAASL
jgi:hypothetical protein